MNQLDYKPLILALSLSLLSACQAGSTGPGPATRPSP